MGQLNLSTLAAQSNVTLNKLTEPGRIYVRNAEFVDDFTKSEGNIRKVWQETLIFIIGERGKKPILSRLGSSYRDRHG